MRVYLLCNRFFFSFKDYLHEKLNLAVGCEFVSTPEDADIIVVEYPAFLGSAHGLKSRFRKTPVYLIEMLANNVINVRLFKAREK